MRVVSAWVLVMALGCGSKEQPKRHDVPVTTGGSNARAQPPEPDPQAQTPPDFPEGTQSLELVRTVGVRLEPGDDAKRIGTVAVDTRVGWDRTAPISAATGLPRGDAVAGAGPYRRGPARAGR